MVNSQHKHLYHTGERTVLTMYRRGSGVAKRMPNSSRMLTKREDYISIQVVRTIISEIELYLGAYLWGEVIFLILSQLK